MIKKTFPKANCHFQALLIFTLLVLFRISAVGQTSGIDSKLKDRLDSVGKADQLFRAFVDDLTPALADSLANVYHFKTESAYASLMAMQNKLDSLNFLIIEDVIKNYGYPGISLVGAPCNEIAFYVIQHSAHIKQYLPLLQKAAREKQLAGTLVAMAEDRLLVEEEQEQLYGTQLWGNAVKDSITGISKPQFFFNPIKDAMHVNDRRRKAGFQNTIEQYAQEMNVPYCIKKPWWWKK